MESRKTTLLLAANESLFRELLHRALSQDPRLDVVGVAEDTDTALRLATTIRPAAVLLEVELSGTMDAIGAAANIKLRDPRTAIVLLSGNADHQQIANIPFRHEPGWGYLLTESVHDLEALVRSVLGATKGMVTLDATVLARMQPRNSPAIALLSGRQREVLALIAEGYSNTAIAAQLGLRKKSVESYITGLYETLAISSGGKSHPRVGAALLYLEDLARNGGAGSSSVNPAQNGSPRLSTPRGRPRRSQSS